MANIDLSENVFLSVKFCDTAKQKQTDINTDAGKQIPKASGERTE